ncbi:MAG: exodeoxyribonuclease VII small subunit [Thiotrichaceae bacterium]|nr:exodeoxyribonuclease VII small subunit [Thiotrichaceae bacterium]
MNKDKAPQLSFEKAMQELEQLVETMEKDSLSLEDALQKFQQGVELTRYCQQSLAKVEQEIKILTAHGD